MIHNAIFNPTLIWPAHEMLVLIALASDEDSGLPAHTPGLTRAFASRIHQV